MLPRGAITPVRFRRLPVAISSRISLAAASVVVHPPGARARVRYFDIFDISALAAHDASKFATTTPTTTTRAAKSAEIFRRASCVVRQKQIGAINLRRRSESFSPPPAFLLPALSCLILRLCAVSPSPRSSHLHRRRGRVVSSYSSS